MLNEFPQAQIPGEGGRQEQTGIGHQAVIVKDDTDTVGVADPPGDAVGQQVGQGAVDRGVWLTEDACQLCRIDERHPAEDVEHLSVGEGHIRVPVSRFAVFGQLL